jgi:ribosome-associated heat shock protein Hsp15
MAGAGDNQSSLDASEQRLDRWLWFSRMLKSRTMAAQLVSEGKVRVNRARVVKPSQTVRPGDVLTIALRGRVQILRVLAAGCRRGPPEEARQLYEPVEAQGRDEASDADPGSQGGRPSKRDRRMIHRVKGR